MVPEVRDLALLRDILSAAREIEGFVASVTLESYVADTLRRRAVERCFGIIGEAARRLSTAFRDRHPHVPWKEIVGLRNVLAHEYGTVVPERVWMAARRDLPALVSVLEPLAHVR